MYTTFMKICITMLILCAAIFCILFIAVLATSEKDNRKKIMQWIWNNSTPIFSVLGVLIVIFLAMLVISVVW